MVPTLRRDVCPRGRVARLEKTAIDGAEHKRRKYDGKSPLYANARAMARGILSVPGGIANGLEPGVFSRNLLSPKSFCHLML